MYLVFVNPQLESFGSNKASHHQFRGYYLTLPDDLTDNELIDLGKVFKQAILSRMQKQNYRNPALKLEPEVELRASLPENASEFEEIPIDNFYRFGNWVKVRSGVYDGLSRLQIGNFFGQISDFYTDESCDIFYIQWGSNTLKRISSRKIKRLIKSGTPPFGTFVSVDLILPVYYMENLDELNNVKLRLFYENLPPAFIIQFQKVFTDKNKNSITSSEIIWEEFWHNQLKSEPSLQIVLKNQEAYSPVDTCGSDARNGVWIQLISERVSIVIPVADILEFRGSQEVIQIFEFYKFWATLFLY